MNARPLGSRLTLLPRNPESPTLCYLESCKPAQTDPESALSSTSHLSPSRSHQSSVSETGSYVEMKMEPHLKGVEGWEPGEEEEEVEEEGLGYMMMSPQVSHSSPVLPQDDYVTMASPPKHHWPFNR